ncbi:MAG: PrsW family glutamic-type intramembrane protease [Thermoplasmatota archaeon]
MVNIMLGILYGVLAAVLPAVSLLAWTWVFTRFFPYSRREFAKVVFLKGADRTLYYIMLGMVPIFFLTVSLVSAGLSFVGEGMFLFIVYLFDPAISNASQVIVGMSAGPIEESMKLLAAGLIFMTIHLIWKKVPAKEQREVKRDTVKDGIIIGVFAGASFGFLESILYLFAHFVQLSADGVSFILMDLIIWRFVLGVFVHALYTGIASAGLGRRTFGNKALVTSIALSISVILHSLNNGIVGYISLMTDLDDAIGVAISDVLQVSLILVGIVIFIFAWKTSRKF